MAEEQSQPTSAAPPAAANGQMPAEAAPWYASIEDPLIRGVAELRKWSSPAEAVKSYTELEKMKGIPGDRILAVPEKPDDAEGWNKVYDRLGRPAKPEDYNLPVPQDFGDPEFAKAAAVKFHGMGFSQKQATDLATWWNEQQLAYITESDRTRQQEAEMDLRDLRREWGGAYEEREELAKRAVREFIEPLGMDADTLTLMEEAIGTANLIKLFAAVGEKLGESRYAESSPGAAANAFGLTPDAAKARLAQLMQDKEWGSKVLKNPGGPEAAEMDRLQRISVSGGR